MTSARLQWIKRAVFAVAGLAMVYGVAFHSLVAYLVDASPAMALRLDPGRASVLIDMADRRLNPPLAVPEPRRSAGAGSASAGAITSAEPAAGTNAAAQPLTKAVTEERQQVRSWVELALKRDPLNARAFRILGQLAEKSGEDARAAQFMRTTMLHSRRESQALYWLIRQSTDLRDYATALQYADALMRSQPRYLPYLMPTLVKVAEDKSANPALKQLIMSNPPWRAQFFAALPANVTDARTPLDLLLAIKDTPHPPTTANLNDYFNLLIHHKFYDLAYYTWLQFLPPEQLAKIGLLFNGSFEIAPSGLPFDWSFAQGSGVTVEIAERSDKSREHALSIEFRQGRVEFSGVGQMLMLTPGNYQLKGKLKGEVLGRRGMIWRVTCAEGNRPPLGASAMFVGSAIKWQDFDFSFTVPDANCRAQSLRLELDARSASEQLVTGLIMYDELQLTRIARPLQGN